MITFKNKISEFSSLSLANTFANRCIKIHLVVLGDNGKFWAMLPKYSEILVKQGYQYAN